MQWIVRNKKWLRAGLTSSLVLGAIALLVVLTKPVGDRGPQSIVEPANPYPVNKEMLAAQLGPAIRKNQFPETLDLSLDGGLTKVDVDYTVDDAAQEAMEKLLQQYHPDYGAFVAMDAKTGRIIAMTSFSAVQPNSENLALQATFPAASIFKIVTASAAIDTNKAQPETVVPFNGANHTLYKKNVQDTKVNRWTRMMTMREAFARSVNVVFGKLGLFLVGPENLMTYANRYMFNKTIRADIPVDMGSAHFGANDPWGVVQAASGFTRETTMSPVQGMMMAAAVANDGVMMEPYLVDSLVDASGKVMYEATPRQASVVVEPQAAEELRSLFHETVRSGTSRKSFRQITHRSAFDEVEFGGKTGSLTGLNPQGKCDWFVGYARFNGQRIAVAALTVNEKKWRVKSSMLAKLFFDRYLKKAMSPEEVAKNGN